MCNRNSFRRHLRDAGGIGIERKSTVDKEGACMWVPITASGHARIVGVAGTEWIDCGG